MPRATVSTEAVRIDLKTCPPDGYVILKRMAYGEWLHRQDIAFGMQIEMADKKNSSKKADIDIANKVVAEFEFGKCIVDHNLEDENGNKLNFQAIGTLDRLDPTIGSEIGAAINELHEVDEGN